MRSDSLGNPSAEGSWLALPLVLIGIALSTLIVYAQLYDCDFVNFDDDVHVYDNPHVKSGLTSENIWWAFGIHGPSQWHPLSWLSHQLDVEMFGLNPAGHHLTNLAFHIASAMLLFLTLRHMTRELWPSAFVATIFALHPLNVESVAWISERRNVLSMFFGIWTIFAYSSYCRSISRGRYLLVVFAFTLSLMAKPMLVTMPFVLLLLDFWPLRRITIGENNSGCSASPHHSQNLLHSNPRWLILEKLPLLMLSAASCTLTIWCQQSIGTVASTETLPAVVRLANTLSVYGIYASKVFWPVDLAVFYPHPGFWQPHPLSYLATSAIAGGILLVLITTWSFFALRRHPYLAVGWLWYLGTLVPMVGLIQVGGQQMADRYMYFPLIGFLVAFVWVMQAIVAAHKKRSHVLRYLAAVSIAACIAISWKQTSHWKDSITLFRYVTTVTEHNHLGHNNLGFALHQQGKTIEALAQFEESLLIAPDYALARYNLGVVWQDLGRISQSIPEFLESIRLDPNYVNAYVRLGAAYAQVNQLDKAVYYLEQAVRLAPENPSAHLNLGITLGRQQKAKQAITQFRQVTALEPDNVKAHYGLSTALNSVGRLAEAEVHLLRTIALSPGFAPAYCDLGKLLLGRGDRELAIQRFRQALQCDPGYVEAQLQLQDILRQR